MPDAFEPYIPKHTAGPLEAGEELEVAVASLEGDTLGGAKFDTSEPPSARRYPGKSRRTLISGGHEVLRGVKLDYQESDNRAQLIASGVGMAALQALDRARASVVFVPEIAVHVLSNTGSPTEAALAGGAAFAGWCGVVGGATAEGLNQYPKTVEAFSNSFPGFVNFFETGLPGYEIPAKDEPRANVARRVGHRAWIGVKRSLSVIGIGTTAYVGVAAAKGEDRADIHKLNLNASLDGGLLAGGIVFGLGELVTDIAASHPLLAERIENDASNIRVWLGIAGFMIAQQFTVNKLKARHQTHKAEQSETTD